MISSYNPELEQSVLYAGMLYADLAERILLELTEDHFVDTVNKALFKACKVSFDHTHRCDTVTVLAQMVKMGTRHLIKGENTIIDQLQNASSYSNLDYHIAELHDLYQKRFLYRSLTEISTKLFENETSETIEVLKAVTDQLNEASKPRSSYTVEEIIEIDAKRPNSEEFSTGLPVIDEILLKESGRSRGQILTIIGESAHGKTKCAQMLASGFANQGHVVHWFQLEDYAIKTAQYFERNCTHPEKIIITDSIRDLNLLKREARSVKREADTSIIVVDYVQNVTVTDKYSRTDGVEYVSMSLTSMAIEMNVLVILLSQVSIDYKIRKGWQLEPRDYDVRWSQQLKQDSHCLLSVFRPSKIDDLIEDGITIDWCKKRIHKNSVFLRQVKSRYGEQTLARAHFIHDGERGLVYVDNYVSSNIANQENR
jgi:replicative DNA helicase